MIPLPKELPELRDRMVVWLRSPYGRVMVDRDHELTGEDVAVGPEAGRLAHVWERAALFHIAPSMTDLVVQAKEGIGDAGFAEHDLPTPSGLAVFGAPLSSRRITSLWDHHEFTDDELEALADQDTDPADIERIRRFQRTEWDELLAVSWSDEPASGDRPARVRITWWQETGSWQRAYEARQRMLLHDDVAAQAADVWGRVGEFLSAYVNDGTSEIVYGDEAAEVRVEHVDEDLATRSQGARADMFRALCYLLRQRVAEETVVGPDRAARRRMKREGKEPAPVRLISIRGASASGGGDGSREYVHRWIVRGHWRRQWYRSIQAHRPIWITPYVKGPEDAPLLGGQKVYTASARGSEAAS